MVCFDELGTELQIKCVLMQQVPIRLGVLDTRHGVSRPAR